MAFLDKLGEMARSMSDLASDSLETNELISQINLTKGNIQVYQRELGEVYWAKFSVGEQLDEEAMLICDRIVAAQDKIRELEGKIEQIKAEREAEKAERKAAKAVEEAAQKAAAAAAFSAGSPEEEKPIPVCASCGAVLAEGQKFCGSCGKPVA